MNVSELTEAISQKIDAYLSDAPSDVQDALIEYNHIEFKYQTIPETILAILSDQLKQAFFIHETCLNSEEVNIDDFPLVYKLIKILPTDIESIVYDQKFISNNKNPIFMIDDFDNLSMFNKQIILFFAKALLDNWDNVNYIDHINIFIPNCPDINNVGLIPYLKLLILSEGKKFHEHIELDQFFLKDTLRNTLVCPTKNYSQYSDILYVLSEYNYTQDILQKYLLLYTILENFMYRKPIADLLRQNTGFTIRNFKDLYKKVETGEQGVLNKLYNGIKSVSILPGKTIQKYIEDIYDNHLTINTTCEVDFLSQLPFNTNNIGNDFPVLIYKLRNSIVHNKETEFHLTHIKLTTIPASNLFMSSVVLPIMENIIYCIIFDPNSILDYSSDKIKLYEMS